eukprot:NODE_5686_length_625_cov_14.873494_g5522_i0.p1 GENE.NODE_5686_length_625_cov_14.873494_g5522_i0~~NODE_5686_length_625_cov_14.873494_g5522_i0.p1  ORF type:complete len:175 (-),score=27.32 NODE_5686_length_625_cov_14.873494_g5522_i0:101-589(-)
MAIHPLKFDVRMNLCDVCDAHGTQYRCTEGCDYDVCTKCWKAGVRSHEVADSPHKKDPAPPSFPNKVLKELPCSNSVYQYISNNSWLCPENETAVLCALQHTLRVNNSKDYPFAHADVLDIEPQGLQSKWTVYVVYGRGQGPTRREHIQLIFDKATTTFASV